MRFPFEDELRRERARFMQTIEGLSDEEFESGTTLCPGWAPRDVLAHLIGVDTMRTYFRALTIDRGNEAMVRAGRRKSRAEITKAGWEAAEKPSLTGRVMAWLYFQDAATHHQDVLRGLGRTRELPEEAAAAVFREGLLWSWAFGAKLLRNRVIPTTPGGRPRGRGREVRGTAEALGLWLGSNGSPAGRRSVQAELEFGPGKPGRSQTPA